MITGTTLAISSDHGKTPYKNEKLNKSTFFFFEISCLLGLINSLRDIVWLIEFIPVKSRYDADYFFALNRLDKYRNITLMLEDCLWKYLMFCLIVSVAEEK